ncbi:MAG: rod shape-determining protein MreD [Candidatus Omnitrophica bacterium CG11_big_fil_rev_8_21_14_0_20_41_12]|nr:MAG: rod shape-determining protein MreD [Candidatus Omnitrophica bacterium CG11_big_fil_rev_8_21_14_0_20_41_12]
MKKWLLLLIIAVLAFLQLIWPVFLSFFNCKPDLLLILIVALVFYFDFKTAIVFAIIAGLTKDAFLPQVFALNTILFSIWGYLIYLLSRQISIEVVYVRSAIVLIAALLTNIITGLQIINSGLIIPLGIFLRSLIISSIYTAALSPLVFKLVKKLAA